MTVLSIIDKQDPLLKMKMERFDFEAPPTDPIQLARDLSDTMISHNGLGLAANQCGLPYRVFVLKSNPIYCCYNPSIVDFGDEKSDYEEGCITFPNLFFIVSRPMNIRVRFTHPNGVTDTFKFAGLTSRIFQHELDHVNGIRFTDHVGVTKLQFAIRKAEKAGTKYLMKDFK